MHRMHHRTIEGAIEFEELAAVEFELQPKMLYKIDFFKINTNNQSFLREKTMFIGNYLLELLAN